MENPYEQLQLDYIEELRTVMPGVVQWWNDHCPYVWTDPVPKEARTDFHRRWPTGPAGHPRVIAIFRNYFLAVDELNDEAMSDKEKELEDVDQWGKDVAPDPVDRVLPIDLLVNDLENVAADLFQVMQGMVYVPIATDPDGGVC